MTHQGDASGILPPGVVANKMYRKLDGVAAPVGPRKNSQRDPPLLPTHHGRYHPLGFQDLGEMLADSLLGCEKKVLRGFRFT